MAKITVFELKKKYHWDCHKNWVHIQIQFLFIYFIFIFIRLLEPSTLPQKYIYIYLNIFIFGRGGRMSYLQIWAVREVKSEADTGNLSWNQRGFTDCNQQDRARLGQDHTRCVERANVRGRRRISWSRKQRWCHRRVGNHTRHVEWGDMCGQRWTVEARSKPAERG